MNAEGFSKSKLFEILDGLEQGTRPIMIQAHEELARRHGPDALQPWNMSYKWPVQLLPRWIPTFPFPKVSNATFDPMQHLTTRVPL